MNRLLLVFTGIIVAGTAVIRAGDNTFGAVVKVATACMRAEPAHSSELTSQAVMGTPLLLLDYDDSNWWLVETPDGYQGWMISNALQPVDHDYPNLWRQSPRLMVTSSYTTRIIDASGFPISDVNSGSILQLATHENTKQRKAYQCTDSLKDTVKCEQRLIEVLLPDGRQGFIAAKATTPLDNLNPQRLDTRHIVAIARDLMGVAYLWGGTTTMAMDCSGLAKICYLNQGIILPRDASQQALSGKQLGTDYNQYRCGDLVFFKSPTTGNIIHVGIYDHDGLYIHCAGQVKVNSLDSSSPLYIPSNILAGATRIAGYIQSPGIRSIHDL